jgi:hypothetical protein
MTTQRTAGHVGFSCDACPMTHEDDEAGEFGEAWAAARATGWRAHKTPRGEWEHYCPDCARSRS